MPIAWPATLPRAKIPGMGRDPSDGVLRTDLPRPGAKAQRLMETEQRDRVSLTWEMTDAQFATFRDWHDDDACGGAAWFTLRLPEGSGAADVEARFAEPFSAQASEGLRWTVMATVDTRRA